MLRTTAIARLGVPLVFALLGAAGNVSAQGLAVRGGASVDPVQLYGGVEYSFPPVWESLRPTPSVDFGVGNGAPRFTVNIDALLHSRSLGRTSAWYLRVGGGPVVNRYHRSPENAMAVGLSAVGALSHNSGWFGEFRLGFLDGADARVSLGYRLAARNSASRTGRR